jgi:hypothetical protein
MIVSRSTEHLTAANVCVSLVQGSGGTLDWVDSTGAHTVNPFNSDHYCFAETSSDTGKRVQVLVKGQSQLNAIMFRATLNLSGQATTRFEG